MFYNYKFKKIKKALGVTLVEMAIVVSVIGLIFFTLYSNSFGSSGIDTSKGSAIFQHMSVFKEVYNNQRKELGCAAFTIGGMIDSGEFRNEENNSCGSGTGRNRPYLGPYISEGFAKVSKDSSDESYISLNSLVENAKGRICGGKTGDDCGMAKGISYHVSGISEGIALGAYTQCTKRYNSSAGSKVAEKNSPCGLCDSGDENNHGVYLFLHENRNNEPACAASGTTPGETPPADETTPGETQAPEENTPIEPPTN